MNQHQLVIHSTACGQLPSSHICLVSKDSGDAGPEPADHMAKPCAHKTKEIPKPLPAHRPSPENVVVLLSFVITSFSQDNIIRRLWNTSCREKYHLPACRYVKKNNVESTETYFKQASLPVLIKVKRISLLTHVRDHRKTLTSALPFDLSVCPLIVIQGGKLKAVLNHVDRNDKLKALKRNLYT